MVEKWRKEDESFYETEASQLVYDKVLDCSCILVTANSGFGKTATIRHVALKLKPEGFEIVPVESPEDIIKYKTNRNQLFLIDDVLGKYGLSPTLLSKWEGINEKLTGCLATELGSNKILCTLRSHIALHERFKNASTILNKVVIDLECDSHAFSKEDKRKILIKHLTINKLENEIKTEEIEIMCETNYAFPLLCKLVSKDKERFRKRIAFFRQPLSLFRNELDKMINENKKLYCMLVICMLFNGSIGKDIFNIESNEYDVKIDRVMQTCGLQRNMPKEELNDSALFAIGSYFTKDHDGFRFIHDALEETVGCHFFTFDSRVMFSDCDMSFIRERVRVYSNGSLNESVDENVVIIREDELNEDRLTPLYDRLWSEILNGNFSSLLMSHLFRNKTFVCIFVNRPELIQYDTCMGSTSFLSIFSSERRERSDQSFLKKLLKLLSNNEFQDKKDAISRVNDAEGCYRRGTLMYWIVAFGCDEFFLCVWSKMTNLKRKWYLSRDQIYLPIVKSFFPLAVLGGSVAIVKELIRTGADVNCFSEFWETPLYIAVRSGNYDMVSLLLKSGAQVNLRAWFTMNIPIAVSSNKHNLTSLILEYDLNQTELHKAVRHNDLENIRLENIDSKTKSGWTVLHYAVLLNDLEAVKVLFDKGLPQNDVSCLDGTQIDQGHILCRKRTPKVNIADNNGLTPVHIAVINDNIEILSILLSNKAKVNVRDIFDRTPLHYIASKSVTKLLLKRCSRKPCLDEIECDTKQMSAFRTICFNITLHSLFRNVCRDFINMPNREGNTSLHSVIKRRISKKESSNCIETLIENGANPYLFNGKGAIAEDVIESSCDTDKYLNNSAKYRRSLETTYTTFALGMSFLSGMTLWLSIYLSSVIRKDSQNAFFCVGQISESGDINLVQVKRSINVILLTSVLYWLLSITFYIRYSDVLRRCVFLCLVFIPLGCGSFIVFGAIENIRIIYLLMSTMIKAVMVYSILIKVKPDLAFKRVIRFDPILLYGFSITGLMTFYFCVMVTRIWGEKFDRDFSMHNIKTLNITTSNCTDFDSVNISCASLAYNVTYNSGIDFSLQCRTDQNVTNYNGTLTVESGFLDMSEIGLMCFFCLNLSLHAAFSYCFLHGIMILYSMKEFKNFKTASDLHYKLPIVIIYVDIFCQLFVH